MAKQLFGALKRGFMELPSHWRAFLFAVLSSVLMVIAFFAGVSLLNIPLISEIMEAQKQGILNMQCTGSACVATVQELAPMISSHFLPVFLSILALAFMAIWIQFGYVRLALISYDKRRPVHVGDFFAAVKYFPRLGLAMVLNVIAQSFPLIVMSLIISVLGLQDENATMTMTSSVMSIILVIGGFVVSLLWRVRLGFFVWFGIDRNEGMVQSLRSSLHATKGHGLQIFFIILIVSVVQSVLSAIPLVGMLAEFLPVLLMTYIYRELQYSSNDSGYMGVPPQFPL